MLDALPAEVLATIREFRTCEFSTLAKDGTPIAWPVSALYQTEHDRFQLTTTIAFPQKAFNIRRDPHVSLLFSNPTACGLENPPAVLVQGLGTSPNEVVTSVDETSEYWRKAIFGRQPASRIISFNPVLHKTMDFYYMRFIIYVSPVVVYWWSEGDFSRPPRVVEVQSHVG